MDNLENTIKLWHDRTDFSARLVTALKQKGYQVKEILTASHEPVANFQGGIYVGYLDINLGFGTRV